MFHMLYGHLQALPFFETEKVYASSAARMESLQFTFIRLKTAERELRRLVIIP